MADYTLPPSDPAWAVVTWRADSITLARLRTVIPALMAVDTACDDNPSWPCYQRSPIPELWCVPCQVHRIQRAVTAAVDNPAPPREGATP